MAAVAGKLEFTRQKEVRIGDLSAKVTQERSARLGRRRGHRLRAGLVLLGLLRKRAEPRGALTARRP